MTSAFVIAGAIGGWELIVVVVIVLLLFGGRKIPELMRGLGQGIGEFKKGMRDGDENEKKESKEPK
ncbi:MAG TPA: twin-arginine translocase TatA/TatE family subunit [Tenuifilaceae bacterium]|jgi:sec-independent protein translocase protein TatA|nr:twin-arginine translocase TatA/TatE family subunit [Tenuifilaceae bacterium]HQB78755.1 twin-arginine translocase TatA/TatE family subunit [Tenuifilaceae bacterium]